MSFVKHIRYSFTLCEIIFQGMDFVRCKLRQQRILNLTEKLTPNSYFGTGASVIIYSVIILIA